MSDKIFCGLILALAVLGMINILMPQDSSLVTPEPRWPKPLLALINIGLALFLYGSLGFIGLKLSRKLGFADIWDPNVSNKQRFLIPALIGAGLGAFFIVADIAMSPFHGLGLFPHPPFPMSLAASAAAAIGEEILFRLAFIPFWVWLISYVLLKNKWQNRVFWIVSVFSALAFAAVHIPTVMLLLGLSAVSEIPLVLMMGIFVLNGVLSLFAAHHFKKFGILAAIGIHFWTDIVWHVIWGATHT